MLDTPGLHHDAVDAHGGFSAGSADDFLEELTAARPYIRTMQHNITTVNFVIAGDTAEGDTLKGALDSSDPSFEYFSLFDRGAQ